MRLTFDGPIPSTGRKMIEIARKALIVLGIVTLVAVVLVIVAVVERLRKDR